MVTGREISRNDVKNYLYIKQESICGICKKNIMIKVDKRDLKSLTQVELNHDPSLRKLIIIF